MSNTNFIRDLVKPACSDIRKFVYDTLFPVSCVVCEKEGLDFLCGACKSKLTKLEHQYCIVCQKPSPGGVTHSYCLTPHGADGLVSLYNYHDENVAKLIIKGKYSFVPEIYKILGLNLAEKLKAEYSELLASPFTLVPIPLTRWRKNWRGFNQAEVLCESISQALPLSQCTSVLVRCKATKTQKDVKKKEDRAKNVRDAFALSADYRGASSPYRGPHLSLGENGVVVKGRWTPQADGGVGVDADAIDQSPISIHNQNFLLVDDVVTTGSTLLEAVKVLKRNSANKVWCLTVARD